MEQEYRTQVAQLAQALRELHRSLIVAARRQYEEEHGELGGSYALLGQLTENPAFAWLQPLTALVSRLDNLPADDRIDAAQAADVRAEASRLINPAEGADSAFDQRLRDARAFAPDLVVLHAHARAALGGLPLTAARAVAGDSQA
ncbi:MAG TPA: hypothetical protein VD886_09050 [Herpetosiphonaceae bacterium]|nr:hypothetical protein [Herpetosiphonaceae bacterium]